MTKHDGSVDDGWSCMMMSIPRMSVYLCAGVHRSDEPLEWWYVSKEDKLTRDPRRAAIFPFAKEWQDVARGAAATTKERYCRGGQWVDFVARVLVVGDTEQPDQVIPAWQFEGDKPRDQNYFFEGD